ncbi:hypothetical protein CBL_12317 [Carabus blaptoides fortunei]
MLYKGRLGWKQYLPLKSARFGFKLYLLCESKSGYVYSFLIYTEKGTILSDKYKNKSLTSQVVQSLAGNLLDQGYCITTDNFYLPPELADEMAGKKDICLLSTVHNPQKVRTDKTDKDGNNIMKPKIIVVYNETMGGADC